MIGPDTREKAGAVLFAFLMATSMMVGVIAFSGGAAAAPQDDTEGLGTPESIAYADAANANLLNQNHTYVTRVDGTFSGNGITNITLNSTNLDFGDVGKEDVTVYVAGSELARGTIANVGTPNSNDNLVIETDQSGGNAALNANKRVAVEVADVDNAGQDENVDILIGTGGADSGGTVGTIDYSTALVTTATLPIGSDAGNIDVRTEAAGTGNQADFVFNTLEEALKNITSEPAPGSSITITGDLNETGAASVNNSGVRPLNNGDVVIQGSGNPTVNVSRAAAIDIRGTVSNVTVEGITFNGTQQGAGVSSDPSTAITGSNSGVTDVTIQDNILTRFTGPVLDFQSSGISGSIVNNTIDDPDQTGSSREVEATTAGDLKFTDNTVLNVTDTTNGGVDLDVSNANDVLTVARNEITSADATNAILFHSDTGNGDARIVLTNNTLNSNNKRGTALDLDTNANVDINGSASSYNGTNIGIDAATGDAGAFLNISDITVSNTSRQGIAITGGSVAEVQITDVTVDTVGDGIDVAGGSITDLTIDGGVIDGASTGIDLQSGLAGNNDDRVDITGVTIANTSGDAINDNAGAELFNVTNVTAETSIGGIGLDVQTGGSNTDAFIDVTDSTLSPGNNNGDGLNVETGGSDVASLDVDSVTIDGASTAVDLVSGFGTANSANENATFTGLTVNNTSGDGINVADPNLHFFNVTGGSYTNVSGTVLDVQTIASGAGDSNVNIDGVSVDDSPQGTAATLNAGGNSDADFENVDFTNVDVGIDAAASSSLLVLNSSISNVSADNGPGTDVGAIVASSGTLNVTSTTVTNATNATHIDAGSISAGSNVIFEENTISESDIGLSIAAPGADGFNSEIQAHFNAFTSNNRSIVLNHPFSGTGSLNATFNDITDNGEAFNISGAVKPDDISAVANYYGADYGPGGPVDGNSFVIEQSIQRGKVALATPYLTQSADNYDPTQSGLRLITDATEPFATDTVAASSEDENASVAVFELDDGNVGNVGTVSLNLQDSDLSANTSIRKAVGGNVDKQDGIGFNVSANVTSVGLKAVDSQTSAAPATATQTFSNEVASVNVTTNTTDIQADGSDTARVTLQLVDSNGDPINNTGTNVGWSVDGAQTSSVRDTSTYGGEAHLDLTSTSSNQAITVTGFDGRAGATDSVTISVAQGDVDAGNSQLYYTDSADNVNTGDHTGYNSGEIVDSQHNLAVRVQDAAGNNLEGIEVDYSVNTSATLGSSTVSSNADGWANTTVTLPESSNTTTAIEASAGDFNPDQTDATINVTTQAGSADALEFRQTELVVPSGESTDVGVQVVDQFGNFNVTGASSTVTLETDDDSVISISGSASQDVSTTNGVSTFTIDAEAPSGSVNLTASNGTLADAETTATVGEPQGINLTLDNSSIAFGVSNATDNANVTAQLTDDAGDPISVSGSELRFTRQTSSSTAAATISGPTTADTNSTGAVSDFEVSARDRTGETTFQVSSPTYGLSETITVTTTGAPDDVTFTTNRSAPIVNETVDVEMSISDVDGRTVPVTAANYIDVSTTLGEFVTAGFDNTTVSVTEGTGDVNLTSSSSGTATVDAFVAAEGISNSVDVTFETESPANFSVSNVSPDGANVTAGDNITVTADVENIGDLDGTQTVEFRLDTDQNGTLEADEELRNESVSLNASENATVTFENVSTDGLAAGDYTHGVVSDNDTATASITVEEAAELRTFDVTVTPETITANESTNVTVNVTDNATGDVLGGINVQITQGDSELAAGTTVSGEFTATLNVSQPTNLTVTVSGNNYETATTAVAVETGPQIPDNAVYDPGSAAAQFDSDTNGQIEVGELVNAVSAFADGGLGASDLVDVVNAFAASG